MLQTEYLLHSLFIFRKKSEKISHNKIYERAVLKVKYNTQHTFMAILVKISSNLKCFVGFPNYFSMWKLILN